MRLTKTGADAILAPGVRTWSATWFTRDDSIVESQNVSVALAFVAGLLSFISPCVLPLVPAYIGYLSGRTVQEDAPNRAVTFAHALAFVLGFTTVFTVIFGLAAGLLSEAFASYLGVVRQIGGLAVIVLGLHLLGVFHLPFLDYDRRLGSSAAQRQQGYVTSFLVGVSFSAGWTPCVGPMLGAIFSLALNEGEAGRAILLFFVYSMGLGVPFLVTALALNAISAQLKKLNRYMGAVERLSGLLLIVIGILLLTNGLSRFARFFQWVPPI
jgi:cytochrome c-type biogenesis protein